MSRADALVALAAKPGGTALQLCSPTVGILRGVPEPGRILGPGDAFASLEILDRSHPLLVPEGMAGIVERVEVAGFGADAIPVEHGQPILTLGPIDVAAAGGPDRGGMARASGTVGSSSAVSPEDEDTGPIPARGRTQGSVRSGSTEGHHAPGPPARMGGVGLSARSGGRMEEAIPEGCHAVVCPADGIFYRRPRPGDPAYVEVGTEVRTGQTLGLIEAMKTFSPIPYGGPGLPSPARIVEIHVEDSAEVRHGQVILVVR